MIWQPIETAPKDGTRFIAFDGERCFICFYRKNTNYNAKRDVVLAVIMLAGKWCAAGIFDPKFWMTIPQINSPENTKILNKYQDIYDDKDNKTPEQLRERIVEMVEDL